MKKILPILAILGLVMFLMPENVLAFNADPGLVTEAGFAQDDADAAVESKASHSESKNYSSMEDPFFMSFVLIALVLGLALCIERIIYLNMAQTNTDKLLANVEDALNSGGVAAAKEYLRNSKGPVASIFYQGLERADEGIDMVEKSVVSYGGVQIGQLEKGLSWISLFIALAPMLGFMGTVIGMIDAFDAIQASNNISPGSSCRRYQGGLDHNCIRS